VQQRRTSENEPSSGTQRAQPQPSQPTLHHHTHSITNIISNQPQQLPQQSSSRAVTLQQQLQQQQRNLQQQQAQRQQAAQNLQQQQQPIFRTQSEVQQQLAAGARLLNLQHPNQNMNNLRILQNASNYVINQSITQHQQQEAALRQAAASQQPQPPQGQQFYRFTGQPSQPQPPQLTTARLAPTQQSVQQQRLTVQQQLQQAQQRQVFQQQQQQSQQMYQQSQPSTAQQMHSQQQSATAQPAQKKGLTLTREQMFQAQEMFRTANKLSRPEKAIILGFMAGSRENPYPDQGEVVQITLSQEPQKIQNPNMPGSTIPVILEHYYEMNYRSGESAKKKRLKFIQA